MSSKPVASPAAHSMLSNGTASGKLSMGSHHYTPTIPMKTTNEPQYISLVSLFFLQSHKFIFDEKKKKLIGCTSIGI